MSRFVVHYEMRDGSKHASYSKAVECGSEQVAIQIAEAQGKKDKPGYDFVLKKIEEK